MGADMMVSGFVITLNKTEMKNKWDNSTNLFRKRLLKLKKLVSKEKIFGEDWGDLMEYYDNTNHEEAGDSFEKWLQRQIDSAIDCIGSRETTEWFIRPNKFLMLSGGMSWGDSPTDTMDAFDRVNRIPEDLLEKAGLE